MGQQKEIMIDLDLGVEYADCGQWRSYRLETYGTSYPKLVENAIIEEIDQDGGTIDHYELEKADLDVYDEACYCIVREVDKAMAEDKTDPDIDDQVCLFPEHKTPKRPRKPEIKELSLMSKILNTFK